MNAHELGSEIVLERLQRLFDQFPAAGMPDGHILLVRNEAGDRLERNQACGLAVTITHGDMRAALGKVRACHGLRQLRPRQSPCLGDCGDQLLAAYRLQQIGDSLCVERADGVLIESGRENHRRRFRRLSQHTRGFDAIDARHAYVQQHDVRIQFARARDGFLAVGRLADHLDVGDIAEQRAQPLPGRRFVVDDQNPGAHDLVVAVVR